MSSQGQDPMEALVGLTLACWSRPSRPAFCDLRHWRMVRREERAQAESGATCDVRGFSIDNSVYI